MSALPVTPKARRTLKRNAKPIQRRVRPKPLRQTKRAVSIREGNRLWSRAVRERAQGRCEYCGQRGTDSHHILGKGSHPGLRFLLVNGAHLCRQCHDDAHHWRDAFTMWFSRRFQERHTKLLRLSVSASRPSLAEQIEALQRSA